MIRNKRRPKRGGAHWGLISLVVCALLVLGIAIIGRMYDRDEDTTSDKPRTVRHARKAGHKTANKRESSERTVSVEEPAKDTREEVDTPSVAAETEAPEQTDTEETPEPASETGGEDTPAVAAEEPPEPEAPEEPPPTQENKRKRSAKVHPAHCSNAVFSLTEAAAAGREKLVRTRLKQGYNVNEHNEMGKTPLHLAVQGGHEAVVKLLLQEGGDVLAQDKEGHTPVDLAKDAKLKKVLQVAVTTRQRELEVIAQLRQGNYAPLKEALSKGMNPNATDSDGRSSMLGIAAEKGNTQAVKLLLKAGAKTEVQYQDGKTPLHLAAGAGDADAVRALLQAGADPWAQAGNGAFALHEAVWYGRTEIFRILLPCYKTKNYSPDGRGSGTPVAMAINRGQVDMLREVLRAGLRVNDPIFAKEPLLILAAKKRNPEMVKLLLDAGADEEACDEQGKKAIDYADDTIRQLLQ